MDLKYTQYKRDCITLARSLSIYLGLSAELLNQFTESVASGSVNDARPETWKYHLNLCGEYHPIDRPIYVKSMDTMETILFSKETLNIHRATKKYYAFGSPGHEALLFRLPGRALLINGIINPAKMEDVLQAKDGELLTVAEGLIEEHELHLFSKIKEWVFTQHHARYNRQYTLVHDYSQSIHLVQLQMSAIGAIMNLRLEACKTNEAHSYHVYAYLASHGKLHRYIPYLTRYQQLWLYRNIDYLVQHCGLQDSLEWMIENLLTVRGIPITEYRMAHFLENQPDALDPDVGYLRLPLNPIKSAAAVMPRSLDTLMRLEDPLAPANERLRPWYYPPTLGTLQNVRSASMPTKVLESAMIDTSSSQPYKLADILFAEWAHKSTTGYYTAYVPISHALTGDTFYLPANKAFVLMWYAFCRSQNATVDYVHDVFVQRVVRAPTRTQKQVLAEMRGSKMTAADIAILDTVPQINVQISVEGFYKQCYDIFVSANEQFNRVAQYHSSKKRAHAQAAVLKWYCDTDCVFVSTPTLFSDWFSENGITLSETDDLGDWQSLYETIFTAGSGLDKNNVIDMRQVQKAMLAILKQLSSYTIQFIDEYTGVDIVPLCFVHPRHEATRIEEYAGAYYDGFDFEIKHHASMDYASALYRIQFNDAHHRAHDYDSVKVDFGPKFYGDPDPGTDDGVVDMGVNFESDTSIIGPDMSDWSTDRVYRYMKQNGLCAYPVRETRPSLPDVITTRSVNDLVYPPT